MRHECHTGLSEALIICDAKDYRAISPLLDQAPYGKKCCHKKMKR